MKLRVESEIGRLSRVLVHRPGREIDWMTPALMETLLFDDILDGDEARREHDLFTGILESAGAEVVDAEDLLAEALAEEGAAAAVFEELEEEYEVAPRVVDRLRELAGAELARALVHGLDRSDEPGATDPWPRTRHQEAGALFDLAPAANWFFQRDPQIVLGSRVVVSSMATEAREREALLSRVAWSAPRLADSYRQLVEIDAPGETGSRRARDYPYPTIEGGDVLVASPEIVLVGLSERTNRRGVEELAEYLRREETSFRHLVAVEIPARRSFMHLDTVFTLIDRGTCLGYRPVVEPGTPESARIYVADLFARELAFRTRESLRGTLGELGLDLELVACGGERRIVDQQREQWTDGANAFAVAPGVVILYRRNRRTLDELDRRGFRVVGEEEVVGEGVPLLGEGPTVVTLGGKELSRARGGPRCMTMPLEREPLDGAGRTAGEGGTA